MPDFLQWFVAAVLGINGLILLGFAVRGILRTRNARWRALYRGGDFHSEWMTRRQAEQFFQTWGDAECIEDEFGRRVTPRRMRAGRFPGEA